jgi:hypothetical protein
MKPEYLKLIQQPSFWDYQTHTHTNRANLPNIVKYLFRSTTLQNREEIWWSKVRVNSSA